jgi:hypothetical protein
VGADFHCRQFIASRAVMGATSPFAAILGNFNLDEGRSRRSECALQEVPLTAISALSIGASLTQLSSDDSGGLPTSGTTNTTSDASSTSGSSAGSGPAAYFTLSDQAKANLAATNRLDAYVDAYRNSAALTGGQTNTVDSLLGLLAGVQPTTGGSNSQTTTLQIPVVADPNQPPPFQTFTPTKDISKSVTYDGYTLTLDTDAGTQWYGIELNGNGIQAQDKHFGPSDQFAGESGVTPGTEVSIGLPNSNNEAIDAITVTRNSATASSASVSSSAGGTASTSSVSAQSSSITFLVNYATGQISVAQSATSVSAQSSQASSPGSLVSTVA